MPEKTKNNKKKDIKIILVISIVFVISFVSLRAILADSNPFYVVASGSMVPVLNINDLIIVWGKDNNTSFNNAKVNDIIVFKATDPLEENKTIVHRVIKIFQKGDILAGDKVFSGLCEPIPLPTYKIKNNIIMTKGDANDCSIPGVDFPITQQNYVGKVIYTIPQIGIIPQILKPPVNYILMALIAGLLIASFVKSNKKQEEKLKDE